MYLIEPFRLDSRHLLFAILIALLVHGIIFITYKSDNGGQKEVTQRNIIINLRNFAIKKDIVDKQIKNEKIEPLEKPVLTPKPKKKKLSKKIENTEKMAQLVEPVNNIYPQVEPLPFQKETIEKNIKESPINTPKKSINNSVNINYKSILIDWLNRHKSYPSIARRRGYEGKVVLTFDIDANGTLLSYKIKQKSEFNSLNSAAIKMIKRASPMPPVPKELHGDQNKFSYTIPIRFTLKN